MFESTESLLVFATPIQRRSAPLLAVNQTQITRIKEEEADDNVLPLERLPRRRKLSQLMTDHFLRDSNGNIVLSVVDHKINPVFVGSSKCP